MLMSMCEDLCSEASQKPTSTMSQASLFKSIQVQVFVPIEMMTYKNERV